MSASKWSARVVEQQRALADAQLLLAAARTEEVVSFDSLQSARLRRCAGRYVLVDVVDATGTRRTRGETIIAHDTEFAFLNHKVARRSVDREIKFVDLERVLSRYCADLAKHLTFDRILIQKEGRAVKKAVIEQVEAAARGLFLARCAELLHHRADVTQFLYTWRREFDDTGGHDIRDLQVAEINHGDPAGHAALPAVQALIDNTDRWFCAAFAGHHEDSVHSIEVSPAGMEIQFDD